MRPIRLFAAFALAGAASASVAGPPYQTDDPQPTELGHWEIYNFASFQGHNSSVDGSAGLDLNYGAARGLQLTATLPVAFAHEPGSSWNAGRGDLELGAKYRFINDEGSGWQAAIFPRVILPTSSNNVGGDRVRLLLPLWVQKDLGKTSLFGGGGYEINSGAGNKDFWQAGVAATHDFTDRLSLGVEAYWQSADTRGGVKTKGFDIGAIQKLCGRYSLLVAAGPIFTGGRAGYHSYAALALNF